MSYRISAKNRRLKRAILRAFWMIRFDGINLDNAQKTILFWAILGIISVFFPWIEILDSNIVHNGFSKILGITGIIILLLNSFILYLVLHSNTKEIFKNMFHIFMKDWVGITFLSVFLLLISTNAIFIAQGLFTFQKWIVLWNWVIISFVGSVFSLIGGIILSRQKVHASIFTQHPENTQNWEFHQTESKVDEKNNMKLPF